jgi:tripartite-type tricarboxylate transporter receptor subunit TctC
MNLLRRNFLKLAGSAIAASATPRLALALDYPTRPTRIVAGFAAGGGVDITARLIGQWLADHLGQPFVVENRTGAGGNIGTEAVVNAAADGYTLLLATVPNAVNASLYDNLKFNFVRDIAPVAGVIRVPMVVLVHPSVPAQTIPEFIAYAKTNPGKVNMASAGSGSAPHMAGELFKMMTGVDMVHVPYRGNAPMLQALLQNDVQLTFDTPTLSMPHIQDGKLVALAVTGDRRMPKLPDVPSVKEAAGLDYTTDIWIYVIGPKGIPEPVLTALNKEFITALDDKSVRERLTGFGLEVIEGRENSPAHLKKHIDDFASTYGKLISELGIKAE